MIANQMDLTDLNTSDSSNQWSRFSDLLWFDKELGFWLDISKMKITNIDFESYENSFIDACKAMDKLEEGDYSNIDENRQVGHYWLRNSSIAPNAEIKSKILDQINLINNFGKDILNGSITNSENQVFKQVLWIGIGGSGLGPLLIVEALQKVSQGLPFHFIDNVDPDGIINTLNRLGESIKTTLIVVVSKSGGTPEPKIAMEQVRNFLDKHDSIWANQAVAITMQNSQLDQLATSENWLKRFDLPDWVGGRTSITSSVGLLPTILSGSNISNFLEGASKMDKLTRNKKISDNPAALLALSWLVAGGSKGLRDMVVLPYKDQLQVFSKYLQQLVVESLGKRNDREGNIVNQGIAVYGNKGSTDQHAYVQQLRDGIDNFFVTFIEVLNHSEDLPKINGKNPSDYLSGFLQGTRAALSNGNRQNMTITIRELNEQSLGALIALFERSVGLYAEIINVNAYHQPGVEAGKVAASAILDLQSDIEKQILKHKRITINELYNQIPNSSKEKIYLIMRYLCHKNKNTYLFSGEWNDPETLIFKTLKS